jgi:hypothetical protein
MKLSYILGSLLAALIAVVSSAQEPTKPDTSATVDVSAKPDPPAHPDTWERFQQHLKINFQALIYMTEIGVVHDSLFNPGNRLANIPRGGATVELRPNLQWAAGKFMLIAKPRLTGLSNFDTSIPGTQTNAGHFFMQEWSVRANVIPKTTLSYGREVLQWGPTMSISPSNPFFVSNSRANPIVEIGGRDFFRAVYSPSSKYSFSYLLNTTAGRDFSVIGPFRMIQAIKLDYTPETFNASVILSRRMGSEPVLGGYIQVTASNSLLLYAESSAHRGSNVLYPSNVAGTAVLQIAALKNDFSHIYSTSVLGAAYTLASGSTLTAEYISNRSGFSGLEAAQYYDLGAQNSHLFAAGGPMAGANAFTLGEALRPGLLTLRRNYLFFQILRTNFHDRADLMGRYTANLDDHGGTFAAYATLNCTNQFQVFAVGMVAHGGQRTEAGRLLRQSISAGVRFFIK